MNFGTGFFQIVCFLSAVTSFAQCESFIQSENPRDYRLKKWLKVEKKLFIHTNDHPKGVKFQSTRAKLAIKRGAKTKIITHGYKGSPEDVKIIVAEYLNKKEELNVFTFNWRIIAAATPFQAAVGAVSLGFVLANLIFVLSSGFNIKPEQIHLIGFNMGAHLMGVAGRYHHRPLGKITGLDPYSDYFSKTSKVRLPGLNKKSAKFVNVLHTNAGNFGIDEVIGTIDFFPNGGRVQPMCNGTQSDSCSAAASIEYFAESIKIEDSFWGLECQSYEKFLKKECETKLEAVFGEYGNTTMTGTYFFQTNDKSPYGRKRGGLIPDKKQ